MAGGDRRGGGWLGEAYHAGGAEMTAVPLIVTTSWDDGHTIDLRMAELLGEAGLRGTFYVTFNEPGKPEITPAEIRQLAAMGMEVGSHTLSHRLLVRVPESEIFRELDESKRRLDDILGTPIGAISYPLGYTNRAVSEAFRAAGYRLGRTTEAFHWSYDFDPMRMPVTVEFQRATRLMIARRAARDANVRGMWRWLYAAGLETDPIRLARCLFAAVARQGGVFHLIGRSADVESMGLWDELGALLRDIGAHPGCRAETNSGVLTATRQALPSLAPGAAPARP